MYRVSFMEALDYITEENSDLCSRRETPGTLWIWEDHMQKAHHIYHNLTRSELDLPDKATEAKALYRSKLLKVVNAKNTTWWILRNLLQLIIACISHPIELVVA